MYRVTRTVIRGQFANDECFVTWLAAQAQAGTAKGVKAIDDPAIGPSGSPNDRRYYLWNQITQVTTPKCPNSDPDLVTANGKNGWDTQAEAQAVIDHEMQQSGATAAMVAAANAKAVSLENITQSVLNELKKDAKNAADAVKTSPWLWLGLAALGAGVVVAVKVLK